MPPKQNLKWFCCVRSGTMKESVKRIPLAGARWSIVWKPGRAVGVEGSHDHVATMGVKTLYYHSHNLYYNIYWRYTLFWEWVLLTYNCFLSNLNNWSRVGRECVWNWLDKKEWESLIYLGQVDVVDVDGYVIDDGCDGEVSAGVVMGRERESLGRWQ